MHAPPLRPASSRAPFLAAVALAAVLLLALTALAPGAAWAQANVVGQWTTLPYTMPINPIHVALLHTGKIVVIAGSGNDPTVTTYSAALYDPVAGTISTQTIPWDLFCNGMSVLPDGRALVTGGTLQYDPFFGLKNTTVFDPVTEQFVRLQDMANGRWYPTNTVLSDGRTATFSGYLETGGPNYSVELYTVGVGWSPQSWTPFTPPLYPRMHLLPNGKVFFSGPTPSSNIFDPSTQTWTVNVAQTNYGGTRTYGSSVLLPLTPQNNYDPQVLIMGGDNPATATVELIDLGSASPAWQSMPSMALPRIEMNAVVLPNGKVLAQGGSAVDEDASTASLMAEMFDPATHTWTSMASATYPRLYHSVALLLPDATVWTAGSNPQRGTYEPHMEIYSPPYLFTTSNGNVVAATRPSITGAPSQVGYGQSFQVQTPDAASIGSVVLIRAGADTHAFDMDQRLVGMNFTAGSGALTVTSPPNSDVAPPGYYMLFLVNKSGVPSVATFVQVSGAAGDQPPKGTITNPSADVTITAGQSVTFAGSGTDADGSVASYSWVFPGGTPGTSTVATPGSVQFATPGTYTASLTVVDNQGVNDPSPPTRTITVQSSPITASFTSPAAGAILSGTVTVGMSATGTSGSSNKFVLAANGTQISSQTTSGTTASFAWNTTTVADGNYTLTLTVTDATGLAGTATLAVSVANNAPALQAFITSPTAGSTVSGTNWVTIWEQGASGTSNTFTLSVGTGGTPVATQTTSDTHYTLPWDTTKVPNGPVTITGTVQDQSGRKASSSLSVNVQNGGALTVSFTSPPAGSTVSGSVTVGMSAAGTSGTSNTFKLSIDGTVALVQTTPNTTASFTWDTTTVPNGSHTLSLSVTDATGKTGAASESVTTSNTTSSVTASFTSPAAGSTVSGSVTVGMSATGTSGTSNTFKLSVDGTVVSTQTVAGTTASYTWNTTTATNASHTLSFTVTDATGKTGTASETVTVNNATGTLTVSVTSPTPGQTVSGTAIWTNIWLSGQSGTSNTYTVSINGTVLVSAVDPGTHVTIPWDSTKVPNGPQTMVAKVVDATGNSGTSSIPITVQNASAVTASFTSPTAGSTVSGTVAVGMSATGTSGTSNTFVLSIDGTQVSSQTVAGTTASFNWNTTAATNASHTLAFTVTDSTGKTATASESVTVNNASTSLVASFTSPAAGATVSATVAVGMSVSGASGTSNTFVLSIDGAQVSSQTVAGTTASYSWNTTAATNASHTLAFTITDATGHSASASETVTVSNSTGGGGGGTGTLSVSVTSPTAGQTVSGTAVWTNIWLSGQSGTSNTYTVSINGTVLVSTVDPGTHVTIPWDSTKVPNGPQTMVAKVVDATGNSGTSSIPITVQNASAVTASFTSPTAGSTVSGTVAVGMSATGTSGTSNTFVLSIDGTQVSSQTVAGTTASFNWNTTAATNASHTLAFTVTDATGQSASASETVTVSNSTGGGGGGGGGTGTLSVFITSPTAGQTVSGTAVWTNIWLSGQSGTSNTYTVSINGTVLVSTVDPGTHVTIPWDSTKVPNGPQTMTATVTDATGNTGSASVNITIQN